SRRRIRTDQYVTTINIESDTIEEMAKTMVYTATVRYINELAESVERLNRLDISSAGASEVLTKVSNGLKNLIEALVKLRQIDLTMEGKALSVDENAKQIKAQVIPAMKEIRDAIDFLERYTSNDYWPLPIYREMLFLKQYE